ncbi:MAG TPA: glutathione S-transferase N-terminal domain-containing protein [Stellaceae bacterium]|nr:glutathione S-transferase N-terminal domain-containing protein [Stellaceae bacterium]
MAADMTLHWSPRSPFVRKVMIVAHEAGIADRLACVRTVVGGTKAHLGLMRENPLGKLPTLVLADGTVLYDSSVIAEYFDGLHQGPKLFPAAGAERLTALRRDALGSGMLDVLLQWLAERLRPAERVSQPHLDLWQLKIRACVDALEREAEDLAATPFGIGHIAIGVALAYIDFRFASENWREGRPRLARWQQEFDRRPSVLANLPVDDS